MVERPGYTFVCSYHPGERTQLELSEAIANTRPFEILPVPDPKPLNLYQPQDYTAWEAQIFNFVVSTAPATVNGGASDPNAAAWASIYLADIIAQNTRPTVWIATAQITLASLLTYLLAQQFTTTASDSRYGGVAVSGVYTTRTTIAAGLAFIKGYSTLANPTYLSAAARVGTFLRRMQCGDLQSSAYTIYPSGGGAYHLGGLDAGPVSPSWLLSGTYGIYDVAALWFLEKLEAVLGSSATFGDASAVGNFSASTQATLATMISELTSFIVLGVKDSAHAGSLVTGLSTTAPADSYSAYLNGGGGTGTWTAAATIPSLDIALAVRGIYETAGVTAQVTAVLNWLAAFTANASNATPSTNSAQQTLNGITGTYDPTVAPANTLTTSAPFTEATGALYSFAALGVLSPVLAAASSTMKQSLVASRDTLSNPQPFSTFFNFIGEKYLGPLGLAGLSLQPKTTATTSVPDVVRAAQAGEIYRQAL
jgi:hypothetical protein